MEKFDFILHGKTYAEKKTSLIKKAHEFENLFIDGVTLFWSVLFTFSEFFERMGKGYGLITEFKAENII